MKSIEYIRIISDWEYTNSPLFNRLDWVPGLDLLSCTSCIRRRRANPRIAPVWILISLNHLIYLKWKVYFVYICLQATKPPLLSSPLSTIYTHTELFKLLNLFHFIFSIFSDPSHYLTIYCLHLLRSFSLSYNLLFTSSPIVKVSPVLPSQNCFLSFLNCSNFICYYHCTKPISFNFKEKLKDIGLFLIF